MASTTHEDVTSHAQREAAQWTARLAELTDMIAPRFARQEARVHANAYLRGLLSPVQRKNGWQLAEAVRGVRDSQTTRWVGPVRGTLMGWLVPPHHVGIAGSCLPECDACVRNRAGHRKRGSQAEGTLFAAGLQGPQGLLPLTVPKVQRLLLALVWPRWPMPEHSLAWSHWRRRHQACANACHRRRTLFQQLQL
jgi:hypothetical protein